MQITAAQCRAIRSYLGWTAADVAAAAGTGIMTVKRLEGGQGINASSSAKIVEAFASAGITLLAAGEVSPGGGEGFRADLRSADKARENALETNYSPDYA